MSQIHKVFFVTRLALGGGSAESGPLKASFKGYSASLWRRTALVRPILLDYDDENLHSKSQAVATIVLDCTGDLTKQAQAFWDSRKRLRMKIWLYSASGSARPIANGAPVPSTPDQIEQTLLQAYPAQEKFANIIWPTGDPDIALLRRRLDAHIGLLLEKFYPGRTAKASIHKVGGGLSGTVLFRVAIDRKRQEYFIKLFEHPEEFRLEWDHHRLACDWLPRRIVPLHPVPGLSREAEAQLSAFPRPLGLEPNEGPILPICYHAARGSATCMELYAESKPPFLETAYQRIVDTLQPPSSEPPPPPVSLIGLEDCGPGSWNREQGQTMMDSLRSAEYRSVIDSTLRGFSFYWRHLCQSFPELDLSNLLDCLQTDPPWVSEHVPVLTGPIHGDANSRNFIFPRSTKQLAKLQFIDCGSCRPNGPRLFDLAQMEADLKTLLLTTESDAPGFGDIDTEALLEWCSQEQAALLGLGPFDILATSSLSTQRAYRLIRVIRARAANLSSGDPKGRAYFFFLLYWTIRKLRHSGFPHAKRLLALFTAATICKNMSRWKKR